MANAALNGLILGVLVLGLLYNFRQVMLLYAEVSWLDSFREQFGQRRERASSDNPAKRRPAKAVGADGDDAGRPPRPDPVQSIRDVDALNLGRHCGQAG